MRSLRSLSSLGYLIRSLGLFTVFMVCTVLLVFFDISR